MTLASLRGAIALVSQEVSLFDDTVRANIAYGRFGALGRRHRGRRDCRRRRRLYPRIAARLRHAGRRARRPALGRAAATHRDRARDAEGRADPAARRGDLGARHRVGKAGAGGAAQSDARPDDDRHRASPLDRDRRRSDLRHGSRADCRNRQARATAGSQRLVCAAVPDAIRRGARAGQPAAFRLAARGGRATMQTSRRAAERALVGGAAQRPAARRLVLDHPPVYPPRLRDEPLDGRGRGVAAPAASRGSRLHPRLLARPPADDPDGVAAACPDAHADLGASRRPDHRRRGRPISASSRSPARRGAAARRRCAGC